MHHYNIQISLSVFIPELDKTVTIRVKESANILTVIFKAAEAGPCKVKEYYAMFETFEALAIRMSIYVMVAHVLLINAAFFVSFI